MLLPALSFNPRLITTSIKSLFQIFPREMAYPRDDALSMLSFADCKNDIALSSFAEAIMIKGSA